jgi:hypothetical protein
MKKGLLTYQPNENGIFNIGDYIQSLAASQFFGNEVDFFLDREGLNDYCGEKVALFMNGWFMHNPLNWPPSSRIFPKFIAFHMNSMVYEHLLSNESVTYFKKYEPIGCRDYKTATLLQEKGVNAYFSGCLTLTLGLTYKSDIRGDEIYFVDPYFSTNKQPWQLFKSFWRGFVTNRQIVSLLTSKLFEKKSIRNIILAGLFYNQYCKLFDDSVFAKAIFIKKEISVDNFKNEDEKFEYARQLLNMYSKARFIITSRIHCALPCLALETPVLYIENKSQLENSYCRLDGLRELFKVIENDKGKVSSKDINYMLRNDSIFENKKDYVQLKDKLIFEAKKFVKDFNVLKSDLSPK